MDATTLARKPIKRFTDADFERETKELTVKKLRLDVKLKEEQRALCQQLTRGLARIVQACDLLLADSQPRVTVYTGSEATASSILQTAFEASVAADTPPTHATLLHPHPPPDHHIDK